MAHDLDLLQGTWTIESLEVDGQPMPAAMLDDACIVVEGNRFTSTGMGAVYQGTLELDNSAAPARLDMKFDAGPEKGNTNPGIYQLDGESWKLCLATRGGVRPMAFASAAGSGFALETLVRLSPKTKRRPSKESTAARVPVDAATEFEGEWRMPSGVMDGKAMSPADVRWVKRVTHGDQTTVLAGPQTMLKVTFSFDPAQSPRSIDYLNLAGANKGERQQGIYKLEDDVLTVCVAAPGAPRPREFESVAGDGRTLTAWTRG
jgi:uncharacterized protein (TIGR03067 family)